jgi:chromosome segregation ATPase
MMKGKSILREMLCGLLLGLLIMPAQPAQAQWTVFDPLAYSQRLKSDIKRVLEWVEEISFYQQLITTSVKSMTSLGGMLDLVDKQFSKDMETARLTSDIADIIHDSYQLHSKVKGMVSYQIQALQRIDDRLKSGILDPESDLQDFEDYLMYSMGRNSKETIRLAVRTATADAQVNKWMGEKADLEIELAQESKRLEDFKQRLAREKNNPDPTVIQALNESIQKTEARIDMLKKEISELDEKIQERISALGLKLSDMENFGYTIESTKAAWRELKNTKAQISVALDDTISGMKTSP